MPFYYDFIEVTVPNGKEEQVEMTPPPGDVLRHIEALATQVSDDNADLLVNIGRERLCDLPSKAIPADTKWLPLDHDLPAGMTLDLGFRNNTGAALTSQWIGVKYTIPG